MQGTKQYLLRVERGFDSLLQCLLPAGFEHQVFGKTKAHC